MDAVFAITALEPGSVVRFGIFLLAFSALLAVLLYYIRRDLKLWGSAQRYKQHKTIPEIVRNISGFDFERWTQGLFLKNGIRATVTQRQGDHGIDLQFSYRGKKYIVQCKKYHKGIYHGKQFSGVVGEPALRDLYGTQHHGKFYKSMLITTGEFSRQALAWAKGKPDMALIDGAELVRLIQEPSQLQKYL